MEGGATAAPAGNAAAVGDATGADVAVDGSQDNLTGTEDLPLPVAPYALVSPRSRRYCFMKSAEDCRR
jgi:hypothetical protein